MCMIAAWEPAPSLYAEIHCYLKPHVFCISQCVLFGGCRVCVAFILQYLQNLSTTRPGILTSTDISKALKPSNSGNSSATYSSIQAVPTDQLAVVAAQLLALLAKSSVLLVITLLAELLVADQAIRQSIVTKPGTVQLYHAAVMLWAGLGHCAHARLYACWF